MRKFGTTLVLGGCTFLGAMMGTDLLVQFTLMNAQSQKTERSTSNYTVQLSDRFQEVIRTVSPTVVAIDAVKPPAPGKTKPGGESGSGVMVKLEGVRGTLVVTNNHVISGSSADKITVSLSDDRVLRPTKLWADPETDLAVLLLSNEDLPVATWGDSDRAKEGQWVLAFGSPYGLNKSVTHGIISARDRGQVSLGSTIRIKDFLQTDAAVNPGNSGGPLVNLDGEVIGINAAIATDTNGNRGVAFAIPSNLVQKVLQTLVEKGSVSRGYLGVQLASVMDPADALKLGLDKVQGALVEGIYPGTPAEASGLRANDVILQVEGTLIRNENHLINLISGMEPGRKVRLRVWRAAQPIQVEVTVADWNKGKASVR